jgi:hypothetical protein
LVELSDIQSREAAPAADVIPRLLHAVVLEECVDNRARIVLAQIIVGHVLTFFPRQ